MSQLPVQPHAVATAGSIHAAFERTSSFGNQQLAWRFLGFFFDLHRFWCRDRCFQRESDALCFGVDREDLYFDVFAFLDDIADGSNPLVSQLGNVDQALDAGCDSHECTELGDARDRPLRFLAPSVLPTSIIVMGGLKQSLNRPSRTSGWRCWGTSRSVRKDFT